MPTDNRSFTQLWEPAYCEYLKLLITAGRQLTKEQQERLAAHTYTNATQKG